MGAKHPSVVAELKRREVFRVAGGYAGLAWAVLEASEVMAPRFGLPDEFKTVVLAFVTVGFPIALVCAWRYEITPEGIRRTREEPGEGNARLTPARVAEILAIIGLVAGVVYLYGVRLRGEATSTVAAETTERAASFTAGSTAGERSIAVLPFVNMSDDPGNEYFSDGVSEEILDALANLGTIRVAARTSSFSFKGRNVDIRDIGLQLGVQTVMEGSVRKAGNRVRITAQLIDSLNGYHLWSGTYDRDLVDIFAVQDEIARSIVEALHVPLGLSAEAAVVEVGTSNVEAYNAYLRGLHTFQTIGPETLGSTIEFMKRAIELDPGYAAPYGMLASSYMVASLWLPRETAFPAAKEAFDRALELDPGQGMALFAKAQYVTLTDWDWLEAKKYFDLAMRDKSNSTVVAFWYATLHLAPLGLVDQAQTLLSEAAARDPLDSRIKILAGTLALFEGRLEWAKGQFQLALQLDEKSLQAASALCNAYVATGDLAGARLLLDESRSRFGGQLHPWLLACRAHTELATGEVGAALQTYQELEQAAASHDGLLFFAGDVALSLRKIDQAIDWYARSVEAGEVAMVMARLRHPPGTPLTLHPAYQAILQRMRLDDASLAELGVSIHTSPGGPSAGVGPS